MKAASRARWLEGFVERHHGALDGQRALDPQALAWAGPAQAPVGHRLTALWVYGIWTARLCTAAALQGPRAGHWLGDCAKMPARKLRQTMRHVIQGHHGLFGPIQVPDAGFEASWWTHQTDTVVLPALRELLLALAARWPASPLWQRRDPMGRLYAALHPAALRHINGEYYSPSWLPGLLLEGLGWAPGQSLVDPFGGSGVVLTEALRRARAQGHDPVGALRASLAMVELHPVACAMASAALVWQVADRLRQISAPLPLPVHCDDAILPTGRAAKLAAADLVITNPPWVGWEYIARPQRARLEPLWHDLGLFTARGRQASFVKEDLSTLATVVAWGRYLKPGGRSAVILRASAMTSALAGKGLRRLSLRRDGEPVALESVWTFPKWQLFAGARTQTSVWMVRRGAPTGFPVNALAFEKPSPRWKPDPLASPQEITAQTERRPVVIERVVPDEPESRWIVGPRQCVEASRRLASPCAYQGRTGVFTGGANAVFYLERLSAGDSPGLGRFRNVTRRARRAAPQVEMSLEEALVHEVVPGRGVKRWSMGQSGLILCPHTVQTRLHAIDPAQMAARYPAALEYLTSMKSVLTRRRGFAAWESGFVEAAFYAIGRVGSYSFAPYKVAWRYISPDFVVSVIGPDAQGRPRLVNDKVIFVGLDDWDEAHYLCGLLSADPVRWRVVSHATGTQMSTSAISALGLPAWQPDNRWHVQLSQASAHGHRAVGEGDMEAARRSLAQINDAVAAMWSFEPAQMAAFAQALRERFGAPF